MKNICLYLVILLSFSNCIAQKKAIINPIEKEYFFEEVTEDLRRTPIDENNNTDRIMSINENEMYIYLKDSSLVNASMQITLYSEINDSISPYVIGYLKGLIKNGRKEGAWTKEFWNSRKNEFVVVKKMNFNNGILHGKYQVFDLEGKTLSPYLSNPFDKNEEKSHYEIFKSGNGYYYDYYYDIGLLKEKGNYNNGKKNYSWIVYDKNGKVVKKEYFINGVLIND